MKNSFEVKTKGHYDFLNVTDKIASIVSASGVKNGLALVFVSGSTAALTTMEDEKGLIEDLKDTFEKLAPEEADYKHHQRWNDHNGAAHIKSALMGADVLVPVENGKLQLGTWQQIVLIDFDERPRTRNVIVKVVEAKN